jgi:hypothetical protein
MAFSTETDRQNDTPDESQGYPSGGNELKRAHETWRPAWTRMLTAEGYFAMTIMTVFAVAILTSVWRM